MLPVTLSGSSSDLLFGSSCRSRIFWLIFRARLDDASVLLACERQRTRTSVYAVALSRRIHPLCRKICLSNNEQNNRYMTILFHTKGHCSLHPPYLWGLAATRISFLLNQPPFTRLSLYLRGSDRPRSRTHHHVSIIGWYSSALMSKVHATACVAVCIVGGTRRKYSLSVDASFTRTIVSVSSFGNSRL